MLRVAISSLEEHALQRRNCFVEQTSSALYTRQRDGSHKALNPTPFHPFWEERVDVHGVCMTDVGMQTIAQVNAYIKCGTFFIQEGHDPFNMFTSSDSSRGPHLLRIERSHLTSNVYGR